MGYYHVLSNPLTSTCLDSDPDPADDDTPDAGTAAQILRKIRLRKWRARLRQWIAAVQLDPSQIARRSNDGLLFLIETISPIPNLAAAIETVFTIKNADFVTIVAYIAANSANWS